MSLLLDKTFGICVESSHDKGMGHFFRVLNFINFLKSKKQNHIVFINNNPEAIYILKKQNINFEVVDLSDYSSNWESLLIKKYHINIWVNDRLNTDIKHSEKIKESYIPLITFDDKGTGAKLSDINFCALDFTDFKPSGKKIFKGIEYLILNPEIIKYRYLRNKSADRILVTLGGSDTYGVTIKVLEILQKLGRMATVIVGPSFQHQVELEKFQNKKFIIKNTVKSLINEFNKYDLAITGGGITPFEANASGLPCIIIANELHEISNAKFLEQIGSSIFAGYFKEIDYNIFEKRLDIDIMSRKGIENIKTNAIENIYNKIKNVK